MSTPMDRDPELAMAELCLDAADRAQICFEHWSQQADDAPTPRLRAIFAKAAADEVVFINRMRADADDLMREFDDGFGI